MTTDMLDDRRTQTRMPDGATSLIFCLLPDGESHLVVLGPRTRASYYPGKDVPLTVTVRFRPGSARLLTGVPVSEIVGRTLPLSDLWGPPATRLHHDLLADPTHASHRIEQALRERLAAQPKVVASSRALVSAATLMLASERVQDTARKLSVSERHLRNLFTDMIGLSPKQLARVNRIRTVLSRAERERGTRLATDIGYYDQSHMGAEFRSAMGVPLGAFMAGQLPPGECC
ncbi:AraC-like DNA-binding protein [Actinocrispum wychmicini]|uniref:AraC-like DNA-binding protein n=1 Tax=Actinocrispum wychmicini TaxID=1213861 RepID=A0A4R2J9D3_9PSEU|nr:AraC-like DNA-binding protein [Actinocrispum wychmicini]